MKLQYLIDSILSAEIIALPFVDRYGGVVQTMQTEIDNGTDTPPVKRYPVACDVVGRDCNNTGIYQDLVPDDSKDSVVYWEVIQEMQNVGPTKFKNDYHTRKFRGIARLVVWMNVAKLGGTNCKTAFFAIPPLEKILSKQLKSQSGAYQGSQIRIQPKGEAPHNVNSIFGKYDYPKLNKYALYPYDYFAIDVIFEMDQCLAKGGTFPVNPPVDCPNDSGITRCDDILASMSPETRCCVLKGYNFEIGYDVDFDCLSPKQDSDLTDRYGGGAAPLIATSTLLNGIGEYVILNYSASHELERTDTFSMEAWVKFPNLGKTMTIVSKYDLVGFRRGYYLQVGFDGKLRFCFPSDESSSNMIFLNTDSAITPGVWNYVSLTYNGNSDESGFKLSANGILLPHTASINNLTGTTVDPSNIVKIGYSVDSTFFEGNLLKVNIFKNRILTQQEQLDNANPANLNNQIHESDLVVSNKMGLGYLYGTNALVYPDETGITTGYQGVLLTNGNIVSDIPT